MCYKIKRTKKKKHIIQIIQKNKNDKGLRFDF